MLELLYDALRTECGLSVRSPSREKLREKLYAVRRTIDDDELHRLVFSLSPFVNDELWIVKPHA